MCVHESDVITKHLSYTVSLDWQAWMTATHYQKICKECERWAIWKWKGRKRKKPSLKFHSFKEEIERDLE